MDHRATLRYLGIAIIVALVLGIGVFQVYGGKSIVETSYEIFILAIGGLGAIALQLIIWPERFLPKSVQTNSLMANEQKFGPVQNFRPLTEGETFQYKLRPNQRFFHRGDPVLFWAKFKGKLIDGYLATYIKKPDGSFAVVYDYSTVVNTLTGKGRLNGKEAEGRWSWTFPEDCKLGSYGFFIHAGNHYPPPSLWIRIKALAIHIAWPSRIDFAKGTNQAVAGEWETVEVVE